MPGLIHFSLSLFVLLLIAFGTMRQNRRMIVTAFFALVAVSLLGWYQYIFPAGLTPLFFAGTLATALVISVFFYAVYSYESISMDIHNISNDRYP